MYIESILNRNRGDMIIFETFLEKFGILNWLKITWDLEMQY